MKKLNDIFLKSNSEDIHKRNDNEIRVHSLSPEDDLPEDENYKVYRMALKETLKQKNIHNIAITGNYGIGKSSILRTFAKKEKKKFIYLSVAQIGEIEDKDDSQFLLEQTLLKQLISICSRSEFPLSRLEMVRERKEIWSKVVASIVGGLYVFTIFLLLFKEKISEFLHMFERFKEYSFHKYYLILYVIVGIFTAIFLGIGFYKLLMHTKIKEISLNVSQSDSNAGVKAEVLEKDFEQYRFELIYIIQTLFQKKCSAIIFEDLDRIRGDAEGIALLNKLREINYCVNERSKKVCKFIYVFGDELVGKLNYTKFFDYVMPVVPQLGRANAAVMMKEVLAKLGINVANNEVFEKIAVECPELSDYRTLRQIMNEFRIFRAILSAGYAGYNPFVEWKLKDFKWIEDDKLFAFIIYKVLLPQDYYKIRMNQSVFFPQPDGQKIKNESDSKYHQVYQLYTKGYLGTECMRYIGFNQKMQIEACDKVLSQDIYEGNVDEKLKVLNADYYYICAYLFDCNMLNCPQYYEGIEDEFMLYFLRCMKENIKINGNALFNELGRKINGIVLWYLNDLKFSSVLKSKIKQENYYKFITYFKQNNDYLINAFILKYLVIKKSDNFKWLIEMINEDKLIVEQMVKKIKSNYEFDVVNAKSEMNNWYDDIDRPFVKCFGALSDSVIETEERKYIFERIAPSLMEWRDVLVVLAENTFLYTEVYKDLVNAIDNVEKHSIMRIN